ncbi:MAG: outer membrane protein assembly factor BamD [Pseudomonadales bacterium]|nr:outer membrane protein assembly factor BamD [Pseudomonadales bacterium]
MRFIAITVSILLLTACANDEVAPEIESTELKFYQAAQQSLRSSNFTDAVDRLQQLEARFPFGRFSDQSQLEIIYAYYKSQQPEAARAAADRFIRLHPQHPNIDYAYYLKGMASFEEDQNFLERFLPLNPATRDLGAANDSFADFSQLVLKFPDSQYAPDARQRMIYLKNLSAEFEVNVAKYYIRRGAYIAAANRGRYVFEHFQKTPSVPDALAVMIEAYSLLGMQDLASETLLVLSTNYPQHESLNSSGQLRDSKSVKNNERSWLNIITFGLVG